MVKAGEGGGYLIMGADGRQGRSAVDGLLARGIPEDFISVTVRDKRNGEARELSALGVRVIKADLFKSGSVKAALKQSRATYVFFYTDFFDPRCGSRKRESRMGATIVNAIALSDQIEFVVYGSIADCDRVSSKILHFVGRADVEKKMKAELEGFVEWAVLRSVAFLDTLELRRGPRPSLRYLTHPEYKVKFVSLEDSGKAVAMMLTQPFNFYHKTIDAATCEHTGPELAAILSDVSGQPYAYAEMMPRIAMKLLMPEVYFMTKFLEARGGHKRTSVGRFTAMMPDAMDARAWFKRTKCAWPQAPAFDARRARGDEPAAPSARAGPAHGRPAPPPPADPSPPLTSRSEATEMTAFSDASATSRSTAPSSRKSLVKSSSAREGLAAAAVLADLVETPRSAGEYTPRRRLRGAGAGFSSPPTSTSSRENGSGAPLSARKGFRRLDSPGPPSRRNSATRDRDADSAASDSGDDADAPAARRKRGAIHQSVRASASSFPSHFSKGSTAPATGGGRYPSVRPRASPPPRVQRERSKRRLDGLLQDAIAAPEKGTILATGARAPPVSAGRLRVRLPNNYPGGSPISRLPSFNGAGDHARIEHAQPKTPSKVSRLDRLDKLGESDGTSIPLVSL